MRMSSHKRARSASHSTSESFQMLGVPTGPRNTTQSSYSRAKIGRYSVCAAQAPGQRLGDRSPQDFGTDGSSSGSRDYEEIQGSIGPRGPTSTRWTLGTRGVLGPRGPISTRWTSGTRSSIRTRGSISARGTTATSRSTATQDSTAIRASIGTQVFGANRGFRATRGSGGTRSRGGATGHGLGRGGLGGNRETLPTPPSVEAGTLPRHEELYAIFSQQRHQERLSQSEFKRKLREFTNNEETARKYYNHFIVDYLPQVWKYEEGASNDEKEAKTKGE